MKKPNILFLGIDSLRRDHMSMYGYKHLTTPHMDKLFSSGTVFENMFSPSIPTTPGYASMLTGRDCFGTDVVALGHKGDMAEGAKALPVILNEQGYRTVCVGFRGNAASAGFSEYIEFSGWGSWAEGRSHKAENCNDVAIPVLKEMLDKKDQPFCLFLRHMDPHAPYLPPQPYEKTFYGGDEKDPNNKSLEPVMAFKPFRDFYADWFNPEATDKDYVIAQYDGAIAYMDACIQKIIAVLEDAGELDNTLIVMTSDHGETLYDHDCYFDHHGLYDVTLTVPLAFRWPGHVPCGKRVKNAYVQEKDILPTILAMTGIPGGEMDGRSLIPEMNGCADPATNEPEMYLTECTWMHKHGWRTPEWKFIWALEPDFHFKPEYELYNLLTDPNENNNLAEQMPEMVELFKNKMLKHIDKRTAAVGRPEAPIYRNFLRGGRSFASSEEAYETMHIGGVGSARRLQQKAAEEAAKAEAEKK